MGILKQLSPQSSHAAKQTDLWPEIIDRIEGAVLESQLREVEAWLSTIELQIPGGWWGPIADRLILKREELAREDIGNILRDRFDF